MDDGSFADGRDLAGMEIEAGGTAVSSITSVDSYVRKRQYLREMKRREFMAHRQPRRSGRGRGQRPGRRGGAYCEKEYYDEDETYLMDEEASYYSEDGPGGPVSKRGPPGDNGPRSSGSARSPVYQLEETCIRHPHVLLADQTHVDEWTCMRYCKDETGRWMTKKMVCRECLREMVEEDEGGYRNRADPRAPLSGERGMWEDYTGSSSSSSADDDDNRDTVDVYAMDDRTPLEREAEAQRRRFVRRLAGRAAHFPGNSFREDWLQYIKNTHLVFGIFCHHPLHPVTSRERFVILLGSVGVGILLSNLIYLWFVFAGFGAEDPVVEVGSFLCVTKLMVTLWTLGSVVHTMFDLSIWHIKACTACRYLSGEQYVSDEAVKCGRTAGVTIVLATLAFATYLVLLRASEDYLLSDDYDGEVDGEEKQFIHPISLGGGAQHFDFLIGYLIEFLLAVFVYNPLFLTVVFTGVLGCNGRVPVLGGRPREVKREQRYAMKRQRYTMPQVLRLGDKEYEADNWDNGKLATNF